MSHQWTATATPTFPGWMTVPAEMSSGEAEEWIAATYDELRSLWSERWQDAFGPEVRGILGAAVTTRPSGAVLDALCWPFAAPAAARITVRVGPSAPLQVWVDEGFAVDPYYGAAMGPGVQCIDTTVLSGDTEKVSFVGAHYLFDDGDRMVNVMVEPTFARIFASMAPGLHGFIDSLKICRDGGDVFSSRPFPGIPYVETDEWKVQESE